MFFSVGRDDCEAEHGRTKSLIPHRYYWAKVTLIEIIAAESDGAIVSGDLAVPSL